MTNQELRDQIRLAFPATQFDGPITPCECAECTDLRKELRHKRWDEISAAFLDFTCSPTLLTPEAFQAFLPAYLHRALDHLSGDSPDDLGFDSVVVEFTVYCLCPSPPAKAQEATVSRDDQVSRLLERARLMSPAQIQAIRAFLVLVQENARNAEWYRPFIASALERVWQ